MRYSAKSVIDFISNPENGFIIDGGIPCCPKEKDCLDAAENCKYPTGCHQKIRFFRNKSQTHHYGYFSLIFSFPLNKKVDGDGFIDKNNPSLSHLINQKIINPDVFVSLNG
jgi:hypothetical protein